MKSIAALLSLSLLASAHDWNGIARSTDGTLYVIDAEDGQIWKISPRGKVSVFVKGDDAEACNHPHHLALDREGILWVPSG